MTNTMRELSAHEIEAVSGGATSGRDVYICVDPVGPTGGGYDVPTDTPYDPVNVPPIRVQPTDKPWTHPLPGQLKLGVLLP